MLWQILDYLKYLAWVHAKHKDFENLKELFIPEKEVIHIQILMTRGKDNFFKKVQKKKIADAGYQK